jgi:hypothetical protein
MSKYRKLKQYNTVRARALDLKPLLIINLNFWDSEKLLNTNRSAA